jgi:hypothetical protein
MSGQSRTLTAAQFPRVCSPYVVLWRARMRADGQPETAATYDMDLRHRMLHSLRGSMDMSSFILYHITCREGPPLISRCSRPLCFTLLAGLANPTRDDQKSTSGVYSLVHGAHTTLPTHRYSATLSAFWRPELCRELSLCARALQSDSVH